MPLTNTQVYSIPLTNANWILGWITLSTKWFRNIDFQLYCPVGSSFTIKFVISMQEEKPNFLAAQSASNLWSYVQEVDLNNWTPYDWTTWITISWETTLTGEINANNWASCWIWAIISSYSAWSASWVYTISNNV